MSKQDRQSERLEHVSGGRQIGGTQFGQGAGTAKADDKAPRKSGKPRPN